MKLFKCVDEHRAYGVTFGYLCVCISLWPPNWYFDWPSPTQTERWKMGCGFISWSWALTPKYVAKAHLRIVATARRRGERPVCACHHELW
jgi:hypothetical protein